MAQDKCVIRTHSGKSVNLLSISPDDIDIDDIAHSLSLQCRFNGHCRRFYSVAEHSIHVTNFAMNAKNVDRETLSWMLLHDAAEAYIGDIISPIKNMFSILDPIRPPKGSKVTWAKIEDMENWILQALAQKLNLVWPIPDQVKRYDLRMLKTEWLQLMQGPFPAGIFSGKPFKGVDLIHRTPTIKNDFITCYSMLVGG